MNQLILGIVLGSLLTGGIVGADTLYNSKGQPAAPRGSVQQFDYYRQRQSFLDIGAQRRLAEQDRLHQLTKPCGK